MKFALKNLNVHNGATFEKGDVLISDNVLHQIGGDFKGSADRAIDFKGGAYLFPGFIDVHVHLREPGFLYKETIKTGSMAAAHGGYTTVCPMPNLDPVPDSVENLKIELDAIERDAVIEVIPYGAITIEEKGEELADMEGMAKDIVAFSDDGRGIQTEEMMVSAMERSKALGKIIAAHCEYYHLVKGGYIHEGEYAKKHGHKGICSASEYLPIERDIELSLKTGCDYHVCHVSCKESVEAIRKGKERGAKVTCETAAHYLCLNDSMLQDSGDFKMYPPIRAEEDRLALIEGIKDGTIDMIASDHAPHSVEEKSKGLRDSNNGIVGLETTFPVLYTELVKTGIISIEKLIDLMFYNAAERFGIGSPVELGKDATFTVFDLDNEFKIDSSTFLSKGKSQPFEGKRVYGRCLLTVYKGNVVWKAPDVEIVEV